MKAILSMAFAQAGLVAVLVFPCLGLQGQTLTQSIPLQPGWNAVWLEVQPDPADPNVVFAGLPLGSVWTHAEPVTSAEFIQDPDEAAFNAAGWLGWFPPSRPESMLGNLFAVHAGRAYLIKSEAAAPLNWEVHGRPVSRPADWAPDSFNLRGLRVDAEHPPRALDFLRYSPAHLPSQTGALEPIYRLDPGLGRWVRLDPTDRLMPGTAYWIHTRGASDFVAPVAATAESADGLVFGANLQETSLWLRNLTGNTQIVVVEPVETSDPGVLAYHELDPAAGASWQTLSEPLVLSAAPGQRLRVRLAVRRAAMTSAAYTAVLRVTDGAGTRHLIPVSAHRQTPHDELAARAGLWVGTVTLDAVSVAGSDESPVPTRSPFQLRLLVHLDGAGQTHLLKEVIQMWQEGSTRIDADGRRVVDQPGNPVLLTDDRLLNRFSGIALRDGVPVGRRLSTIGFDFAGSPDPKALALNGQLAPGQSLEAAWTIPHDHPTNPFLHRFHPDHDNLDSRFQEPAVESFTIERAILLECTATPPAGTPLTPDYGYALLGGHYTETIRGLHRHPIHLGGTFFLRRISTVAELNPSPNP